ncbi:hypothetical protein [Streptomyces antibioticus]|uniref:hypothetical protein n=1 Tax=Streptomyces antibioticus TaxID=1890 RepID=UPI0022531712|nr:hypothetical protein [Streptomyces antibioticus]MCX4742469.1 hypothetical protein [Streptomyces antibioticus]
MEKKWKRGKNPVRPARPVATLVAVASSLAAVLATAPTASAATSYAADACSSGYNRACFRIHYNSRSETTQLSQSACFISNKSITNHWGYSPNGASVVRYIFSGFPGYYTDPDGDTHKGMSDPCDAKGDGQYAADNAASAYNQDPSHSYTVYSNTGYAGSKKTIPRYDGIARNLGTGLKNKNSSSKRN